MRLPCVCSNSRASSSIGRAESWTDSMTRWVTGLYHVLVLLDLLQTLSFLELEVEVVDRLDQQVQVEDGFEALAG